MRHLLLGLAFATVLARGASAQNPPQKATTPVGTWRGTSLCLVHPSACHDEVVVYRIARTSAADTLSLDARKIVKGEEEEMGVLTCHYAVSNQSLACVIPRGLWQFHMRGDSLLGDLRLPDNTKFRDVRTSRAQN